MAVTFDSTTDPKKAAANQRALIQQKGDQLSQDAGGQAGVAGDESKRYQGYLDELYGPMAQGNGGYSPEEIARITGNPNAFGTSQEALDGNYLTGDEQAGIRGDTGSYTRYFNPDQMSQDQNISAGRQRQSVDDLKQNLRAAVNPDALKQSGKFQQDSANQLDQNQGQFGTVLTAAGNNVRDAIDPNAVQASQGFLDDYKMSPEEEQNIVTGAGISAGAKDAAAVGDMERRAAAAGSSPMGVAAYRARMARAQSADAGDAMTQARIKASDASAQRKMSGEQLREQGGQYLTNLKTGTEMHMGDEALAGTQQLGQQALDERARTEQQRLNAEQSLAGNEITTAAVGGNADINNEANINNEGRQQSQYNTSTGTGIVQAADNANSTRAGTVANNRQGVGINNQQTQYGQAKMADDTATARATGVANTRLGAQQTGLNYYTGQQQQQNANQQGAYGREQQTYSTMAGAGNQATGNEIQASAQPGLFDKIVGGVTGAVGALGGGKGMKAIGIADGSAGGDGQTAVVGEDGPEWVGKKDRPWWQDVLTDIGKGAGRYLMGNLPGGGLSMGLSDGGVTPGQGEGSEGGRVIDEPTLVHLEPGEAVVPIGAYRARAKVRPSAIPGLVPKMGRNFYGEAV